MAFSGATHWLAAFVFENSWNRGRIEWMIHDVPSQEGIVLKLCEQRTIKLVLGCSLTRFTPSVCYACIHPQWYFNSPRRGFFCFLMMFNVNLRFMFTPHPQTFVYPPPNFKFLELTLPTPVVLGLDLLQVHTCTHPSIVLNTSLRSTACNTKLMYAQLAWRYFPRDNSSRKINIFMNSCILQWAYSVTHKNTLVKYRSIG